MLILTLRTDKPEAELALFENGRQLANEVWSAHRQLAETLHHKIKKLLDNSGKQLKDIKGIVVFKGPGSFTGLRIGISAANALAYGLPAKIAGSRGQDWQAEGIRFLSEGNDEGQILPEYGSEAHITAPKK